MFKVLLVLLINLINLEVNLAQESVDVAYTSMEAENVYNKLPLFSRYKRIAPKENYLGNHKELPVYDNDDKDLDGNKARAVYWIPTTCDSLAERGYTCLSCGESLHCMGGNFALKAICGGRRPFCSNGVCSDLRGEKCKRDDADSNTPVATHATNAETNVQQIDNSTLT